MSLPCLVLLTVLRTTTALSPENLSSAEPPPNVVLIIADDQSWTDFGFQGHAEIETPNLDRLAASSRVFPRGYVPCSLCRPSLASIVTGLYPQVHGITGNDPRRGVDRSQMLDTIRSLDTLPRILGRAGYRSLQTGKWWEGAAQLGGFTDGMTHGDPTRGGRHGDLGLEIGRRTMAPIEHFLDECASDATPFFLWYAPFLPHQPHDAPAKFLERARRPGVSESVARYHACCAWFDATCGTLLDLLAQRDLTANTLVAFVVDNGWIQQESGPGFAERSKRSPYDGGVRTPILLRWPGHIEPRVCDAAVSSIDLAPTLLRACGIEPLSAMTGRDLLSDSVLATPAPVFGATFHHDIQDLFEPARNLEFRFVVDDRFKLLASADPRVPVELYDVVSDPYETLDCAAELPRMAERLQRELDAWWDPVPKRRPRPNLVLLVTDDQRFDMLGCAGNPIVQTPALDRLAATGIRFANSFVTTPICAASRASLLTGRYECAHHYTFGTEPLERSLTTSSVPALLRAAGYQTGFVGKWGVRTAKGVEAELWDRFTPLSPPYFAATEVSGTSAPSPRHLTDRTADAAIDFLQQQDGTAPFFLQVSFNAPHADDGDPEQYFWPHAFDGLYDDSPVPPPVNSVPEFFEALPEFQRTSLNRVRWHWRFDTEEKRLRMTRGYWRMITGADAAIGRILDQLEALGLTEQTAVIFTSDNGYFLGERGFAGKWTIHEESIRVPLIVRDPTAPSSHTSGSVVDAMVLNVDLPPTLLDLAGVPIPASYQGASLLPWWRDPGTPATWRTDFFCEHRFDHPQIPEFEGVRGERWVYARSYEQDPVYEELYDLETDPDESFNRAADPRSKEALENLRERCAQLHAELERR